MEISEYKRLKEEYQQKANELWQAYIKASQVPPNLILEVVNFKGKYLCIDDDIYLFVSEEFTSGENIILRGLGFNFVFGPYIDTTCIAWDCQYEVALEIRRLEEEVSHVKEITKEEFNQAFENMMINLREYHYQNCDETY